MLLKKYRYVSKIKFVRIKLDWSAGDSFCLHAAKCDLSDKTGSCRNRWINEMCVAIGMDSKQNKFSYIPFNVKEV